MKNGFHSPAAGGYCDLKQKPQQIPSGVGLHVPVFCIELEQLRLFLLIAHDKPQDGAMVGSKAGQVNFSNQCGLCEVGGISFVIWLSCPIILRQVCHICELQVHLKQFLACKKYTHLPYVPQLQEQKQRDGDQLHLPATYGLFLCASQLENRKIAFEWVSS